MGIRARSVATRSLAVACLSLFVPVSPAGATTQSLSRPPICEPPSTRPSAAAGARDAAGAFGRLPAAFEANVGQTDAGVRYVARGSGYAVFLTSDETVVALSKASPGGERRAVRVRFAGSNSAASVAGEAPLDGRANYMVGADARAWHTDVARFAAVRRAGIYPGVDAVFYGNQSELEYDVVAAPGADVGAVRMRISGADDVRVDDDSGDLVLSLGGREIRQRRPSAYQPSPLGGRTAVPCRYAVVEGLVRFELASRDPTRPLVIDPVLTYSTFVGGYAGYDPGALVGAENYGYAVAVDAAGSAYVAGSTNTADFPLVGAVQTESLGGDSEVFVSKLTPAGNAFAYSTYLGGRAGESATALAVDAQGALYVFGGTASSDFPVVGPIPGASFPGSGDAFVTKLAPDGGSIVYSTLLGGSGFETGGSIAVDAAGEAVVAGFTTSTDFPVVNPLFGDTDGFGGGDGFVAKISASGGSLVYATYLGGPSRDEPADVAVDASGSAHVVGVTGPGFPTVDPLYGDADGFGGDDAFLARIAPSGGTLLYSTYLGGSASDYATAVALDAAGDDVVVGGTISSDFPVVSPLFGDVDGFGVTDAFVTKVGTAGSPAPLFSTYLGGSYIDVAYGVAVDATGAVTVVGSTYSSNFPTLGSPFDDTDGFGMDDAFVTRLVPAGDALVYSTYLGGTDCDVADAVAVDAAGRAYVVGNTVSYDFPTVNPLFGDTNGFGRTSAFVTRLAADGAALEYSTYLGGTKIGSMDETGTAIAVDAAGAAYFTGMTDAIDFPTRNPPPGGAVRHNESDAFVTKLAPSGDAIVYSTYLGGYDLETGTGVAVDASGTAVVAGWTTSTDFPTANPLFVNADGFGTGDAFVTKLSPAGDALVYSTYLGGSLNDVANGVAVDAAGAAYVVGWTSSPNFPTANPLPGGADGSGGTDAFVTKLSPAGDALAYSTFLGGSSGGLANAVAVDASGAAYVVGYTVSPDFPATTSLGELGSVDSFVTKVAPAGGAIVYSTVFGGSDEDDCNAVAVDASGAAYVAGETYSTDFPVIAPLSGDTNGFGAEDAFAAKLSPAGDAFVYSTYLGGSGFDFARAVAVDASGAATVVGGTTSTDFPVVDPLLGDTDGFGGDRDAFVATLAPEGGSLRFSSYLGGGGLDTADGVAVDADGGVYVVGQTFSPDFPTASPYDPMLSSLVDVFVTKIGGVCSGGDTVGLYTTGGDTFFLRNCDSPGAADVVTTFGADGWVPLRGDWDGDGVDTVGAYDPTTGCFFLRNANTPGPADVTVCFGAPGAVPLSGDWNGDGADTIGVYVPATGVFFLRNENAPGGADLAFAYGGPNLTPVVGDWNGDGTDTVGLYASGSGAFFLRNSNSAGPADLAFAFGGGGAVPVAGDWDGVGGDSVGLYVPSTSVFFLKNANAGGAADLVFQFGAPGGLTPLAGNWDGSQVFP